MVLFAAISLLFVSLITFFFSFSAPRCLKAQNLNGQKMSTAFSVNFPKSHENHVVKISVIIKPPVVWMQGQKKKNKRMLGLYKAMNREHCIREMEEYQENGDCF